MEEPDPRRVFVVHGRNRAARDALFAFLRAIGLQPIEFEEAIAMTGEGSPYIGTILDKAFSVAQAIVVLLTPDEITYLRSEYADDDNDSETSPAAQARPNVLFEAGMAMGRDAERTVLVEFGEVRPFSDVIGRHAVRLDNTVEKRKSFAQRLRTARCAVNTDGEDWLSAGDLTPPGKPGAGMALGKRVPSSPSLGAVSFDAQYHDQGNGQGRLQLVNRGRETVYNLDVSFPDDLGNVSVMTHDFPLEKLPSGKSATLPILRSLGPGKSYFDLYVTGNLADGTEVAEDVFVSLH
jgi:hypothetical protein